MSHYTVRRGDSLLKIAAEFQTSVSTLVALNHLKNANVIDVGEVLTLPDSFAPAKVAHQAAHHATAAAPSVPAATLKRGSHGPAVKQLQTDLVKLGFMSHASMATGPGIFGGRTEAGVKAFQHHAHLSQTGTYDAKTRTALAKALGTHAPATPKPPKTTHSGSSHGLTVPSSTGAAYTFFSSFVKSQHGTFSTAPGHINLIGFRKNNRVGAGSGAYKDVLYAVWKDTAGKEHVRSFKYDTEPAANMRYDASDVNGDGKNDLGRVPAGFYNYAVSSRSNGAPCLRPTSDFKAERDTNQNGKFDESRRYWGGDAMLFHKGGYSGTGSAGCQTFSPDVWASFWGLVRSAHGSIGYTLTTTIPKNV